MTIQEERMRANRLQVRVGKLIRLLVNSLHEQGKTNAEIAEIIDLPESSVRNILKHE